MWKINFYSRSSVLLRVHAKAMLGHLEKANCTAPTPSSSISQPTPLRFYALIDREGIVFSSPMSNSLPEHTPPFPPDSTIQSLNYRTLHYLTNDNFYLAFVPHDIEFTGPLLGCLDYSKGSFSIKTHNKTFFLRHTIGKTWFALEYTLQHTIWLLMRILSFVKLPGFKVQIPRTMGYTSRWATANEVQEAAWHSREAFIGLCTLMSFLIAACKKKWPPDHFWCHALHKLGGCDPTYLNLLSANLFFSEHTTQYRHVGVMVDANVDQKWHLYMPLFFQSNIPVWFHFCHYKANPQTKSSASKLASPSVGDVHQATKHLLPQPNPADNVPHPHPQSGQKRGQTWQQFFMDRDAANALKREQATVEQHCKWDSWKSTHDGPKGQQLPGKSTTSPVTYVWMSKDDSEEDGILLHKRIRRDDVENFWYGCHSSERIYDLINNTWDLCKPAGQGRPGDQFEGMLDYEVDNFVEQYGDMLDINVQDLDDCDRTLEDEVQLHVLILAPPENVSGYLDLPDILEDILRNRYSFVGQPSSIHPIEHSLLSLDNCLKALVYRDVAISNILELSLVDFVTAVSRSRAKDKIPFCALNPRLDPRPPYYLLMTSNSRFKIRYLTFTELHSENKVADPTYCILPLNSSQRGHWDLFVDDPLTALQIIRSGWGPSLPEVAHELIIRGIPFNTFLCDPKISQTSEDRSFWQNHFRSPSLGHTIELQSIECYNTYVETRNQYVRKNAHLRAALCAGGIVWRLMIDVLEPDVVLDGPCSYFEWSGQCQLIGNHQLWDDALSAEELDLICGVYSITMDGKFCVLFAVIIVLISSRQSNPFCASFMVA